MTRRRKIEDAPKKTDNGMSVSSVYSFLGSIISLFAVGYSIKNDIRLDDDRTRLDNQLFRSEMKSVISDIGKKIDSNISDIGKKIDSDMARRVGFLEA
jgi:hypothetical protein